jgi:hypothetical protein
MLTRRTEVIVLLAPDGRKIRQSLFGYLWRAAADLEVKKAFGIFARDSKLPLIAGNAQDEQTRRGPASFCVAGTRQEISHNFG